MPACTGALVKLMVFRSGGDGLVTPPFHLGANRLCLGQKRVWVGAALGRLQTKQEGDKEKGRNSPRLSLMHGIFQNDFGQDAGGTCFFGLASETPELKARGQADGYPSSHVALQCMSEVGTLSFDLFRLLPPPKKCHNIKCVRYVTWCYPSILNA